MVCTQAWVCKLALGDMVLNDLVLGYMALVCKAAHVDRTAQACKSYRVQVGMDQDCKLGLVGMTQNHGMVQVDIAQEHGMVQVDMDQDHRMVQVYMAQEHGMV